MLRRTASFILALALILSSFCMAEMVAYDDKYTVIAMLEDQSDFIYVVETALYEKGYLNEIDVDGYFDTYTEAAVMTFQYDKGYQPDGMLTKTQFYKLSRTYYSEWFDASDIVWITPSGSRCHRGDCKSLANSYNVMPVSMNIAYTLGYTPCKLCRPY